MALANLGVGHPSASNYNVAVNTVKNIIPDWNTNNLDTPVKQAARQMTPAMLSTSNINQQQLLQQVRLYQPGFQPSTLNQVIASLCGQPASTKQNLFNSLANSGLTGYLNTIVSVGPKLAAAMESANAAEVMKQERLLNPAMNFPPISGGGGGFSCAQDGVLLGFATAAALTITVMSGGLFFQHFLKQHIGVMSAHP